MDISKLWVWPLVLEYDKSAGVQNDFQWLVVRGIGFILVALVYWKFVVPMFRGPMNERKHGIITSEEQITSTLREAEELRNDYQLRLQNIETETQQRLESAVLEAGRLRDTILSEAQVTVAAIIRRGEDESERERAKAFESLRNQVADDVIAAASHAAGETLTAPRQRKLIADFVGKLGAAS